MSIHEQALFHVAAKGRLLVDHLQLASCRFTHLPDAIAITRASLAFGEIDAVTIGRAFGAGAHQIELIGCQRWTRDGSKKNKQKELRSEEHTSELQSPMRN